MSAKKTGALLSAAVLSIAVLFAADQRLRSMSGWIGADSANGKSGKPFLADVVFASKYRMRLRAKNIVRQAEDVESRPARADLYFRAIDLLKEKENAKQRDELLERICNECPDAPQTAEAWTMRLMNKLAQKPPADPGREVNELVRLLKRFGVGKDAISPRPIQNAIASLKKTFPSQAEILQSALESVAPTSSGKKK